MGSLGFAELTLQIRDVGAGYANDLPAVRSGFVENAYLVTPRRQIAEIDLAVFPPGHDAFPNGTYVAWGQALGQPVPVGW